MRTKPQKRGWAVFRHASEAKDYFATLLKVRGDQAAAAFRRRATNIALGAIAGIAIITFAIASIVVFVRGVTGGFAALFDGRAWLGDLVGGIVLIGALAAAIGGFLVISARTRFARLERKYQQIHEDHRAEHGRHILDDNTADEPKAAK